MTLSIDIPANIESSLRVQFGPELERRAKEELATAWFSEGQISSRQVAEMLGMSLFEAHAFLKARGASLPMSAAEVEADSESLRDAHES
ncbi:MAG: UPF0175 family protein [Pirellulales bacterium]